MTPEQPRSSRRTVLKGLALGTAACMVGDRLHGAEAAGVGAVGPAPRGTHGHDLPRSTPEAVGIDPSAVLAFVDAVEQKPGGMHSFMLLRHGRVAAEGWWSPYAAQYPHMLFSLSKSFTSTAAGLAVADGRLNVDATVVSFFPDDLPSQVSENLAAMRVRHLLSMSTGHDKDATGPVTSAGDSSWVKAFLALPVEHEPGTHFVYNSAATYMVSAIVQKLTGKTVLDYLRPRLFDPLGIEGETWEKSPQGINMGGWGLSIKTEDIARFGQLYLQKGRWNGRELVPEKWVDDATSKHISNGTAENSDWSQGYGYQFWRCRHGAYRGDGAFGQFCVVMPEQDAVLAITSGVGDMQAVLNAAWDHLLPAMQEKPLPASEFAQRAPAGLKHRLAGLSVPPPEGKPTAPTAAPVSGKTYRFEPNDLKIEAAALTFDGDHCTLSVRDDRGERRVQCGNREWVKGTTSIGEPPSPGPGSRPPADTKVAARGAWADDETYVMKLCAYETPFIRTITAKFAGDQLTLSMKVNVGFGPTERPPIVGRMA